MEVSQKEMAFIGSLKGFKHFECHLRGKEEMTILINNNDGSTLESHSATLYLLGCYSRHNKPYVWIRSHLEKQQNFGQSKDASYPLPLRCIRTAPHELPKIREVIAELVIRNSSVPVQPFEIDFDQFTSMSPVSALLSTAAMIVFLKSIYVNSENDNEVAQVYPDLQKLIEFHFRYVSLV
eukprot:c31001_g1_i1.p1 GENE.c31001_g1_i1~~c31001_g1_i1.p1  ORF type:complete len:180 (+),score=54.36 c31001_g1_i1:3-542(+)